MIPSHVCRVEVHRRPDLCVSPILILGHLSFHREMFSFIPGNVTLLILPQGLQAET